MRAWYEKKAFSKGVGVRVISGERFKMMAVCRFGRDVFLGCVSGVAELVEASDSVG
jgi:hypothetical protein